MNFEDYLDQELTSLTRFAGVLVGDRQDAHDVLADSLLKASIRWSAIEHMANPTAYVRQIVVSEYINMKRKQTRRKTFSVGTDDQLDQSSPDTSNQTVLRDATTDVLLRRLTTKQRSAIVLRYYLDSDDRAISEALSISPSTVRSTISRALAALRITPEASELLET